MPDNTEIIQANFKKIEALKEKIESLRPCDDLVGILNAACVEDVPSKRIPIKSVKILTGHFGKIYGMDWGKDENTVLSAAQDGSLIIWNAQSQNKIDVINLRSSWVMCCAMSDSGMMTASGGLDNICTIYKLPEDGSSSNGELKSHKELLGHGGYLSSASFVSDEQVLSTSGDGTVILWDIAAGKVARKFEGHTSDVMSVDRLGKESSQFVSGSCDMMCKVWDHRDEKADVLTFPAGGSDINTVSASRSGNFFCSGGDESAILLHDIRSYGPLQEYRDNNILSSITSTAFSASSRLIFAGYDDNNVHVWDTLTGEQCNTLAAHQNRVSCLGVNKAGNALCTGSWDMTLRVWA